MKALIYIYIVSRKKTNIFYSELIRPTPASCFQSEGHSIIRTNPHWNVVRGEKTGRLRYLANVFYV